MIYVSIDIAKLNHFASLISSDNEILVEPFQFSNDDNGFQYLVSAFKSFDDKEIIIGLESTAHYADNLIRYGSPLFSGVSPVFPGVSFNSTNFSRRTSYFSGVVQKLLVFPVYTSFYRSSPHSPGVSTANTSFPSSYTR